MLPDRVSNPGPLTYESGALPILGATETATMAAFNCNTDAPVLVNSSNVFGSG